MVRPESNSLPPAWQPSAKPTEPLVRGIEINVGRPIRTHAGLSSTRSHVDTPFGQLEVMIMMMPMMMIFIIIFQSVSTKMRTADRVQNAD